MSTHSLLRDVLTGARRIRTERVVSLTVALTTAIAIAACTTIFTVVDDVLLRPLPYRAASSLVAIAHRSAASTSGPMLASAHGFQDYAAQSRSFSALAIENETGMNLTGAAAPERLSILRVSGDWFNVYSDLPALGRTLVPDDQTHDSHAIVLTYGTWAESFGSDRGIVGRTLLLNGEPYHVVGVTSPGFHSFFKPRTQAIVPLALGPDQLNGAYASALYHLTGRLKPIVSVEQAALEMRIIGDRMVAQHASELPGGFHLLVRSLDDLATADIRPVLLTLTAAVAFLLLIACANVAGILLARAAVRAREIGLRSALGASQALLVRQLLVESMLLALAGSIPGLLLAWGALHGLTTTYPDFPRATEIQLDGLSIAFSVGAAALAGLLFGTAPALLATRRSTAQLLRIAGRGGTADRGHTRLVGTLVAGEVALALVLLVVAGLLVQSMKHLRAVDPGFDAEHALVFKASLPTAVYPNETAERLFVRALTARLATLNGVRSVGVTSVLPFSGNWSTASIMVEGQALGPRGELPSGDFRIVTPGFFAAMRMPIRKGRDFTADDDETHPRVAIVDESYVKRFFHGDPIGQRIALDPQPGQPDSAWVTVIGVVPHAAHEALDAPWRIQYYFPYAQRSVRNLGVVVGTDGEPTRLMPAVRAAVRALDAQLPLASVATLSEMIGTTFAQRRLAATMLGAFSAVALLLAAVGLYGLLSYSVERRSRELGIRRALGGSPEGLVLLVMRQGLTLTGAGLAVGSVASLAAGQLVAKQLFQVTPQNPPAIVVGVGLLVGVALVAVLVPALRAMRADPMVALTAE